MAEDQDAPKIQVDSDWKAQAQAEKQRLAEQARGGSSAADGAAGAAPGQIPPANFETLLSTLVTQALVAMGAVPDPATGKRYVSLDLARHHIDLLAVLEDKTKGNLTEDESKLLSSTLYELRSHYVKIASSAGPIGGGRA
jgi:hypothetical protein